MTGYSPNEIIFGQAPRLPIDITLHLHSRNSSTVINTVAEYMAKVRKHREQVFIDANKTQREYDRKRKLSYDAQRRRLVTYRVGDWVTLYNLRAKVGKQRKFSSSWKGLWQIVAVRDDNPNVYMIRNAESDAIKIENARWLKLVHIDPYTTVPDFNDQMIFGSDTIRYTSVDDFDIQYHL